MLVDVVVVDVLADAAALVGAGADAVEDEDDDEDEDDAGAAGDPELHAATSNERPIPPPSFNA